MSDLTDSAIWPGLHGEDADGPYLVGCRCGGCGRTALMAREVCPICWTDEALEAVPIGRRGTLYSSTVVHTPAPGFGAPYGLGLVDIEAGLRVFAHIELGDGAPAIGGKVRLTLAALRRDEAGRDLIGPRYRGTT